MVTLDIFLEYEKRLIDDIDEKNALFDYFEFLIHSRNSNKECIVCVLGSMLGQEIQDAYSAFGRESKEDFSLTLTYSLLKDAVAGHFGQNWDEKNFRSTISKWFTGSSDRFGRRSKRQKRRSKSL
ncbi:uncharacterized protein [Fopius arisanus]|uniref:Uncharacterized protein n=1 Tax=Fopius arisanus TaxID=64838 RepID=A0A0C9RMF0_9HYME|nr:PREDICTED: uncharacterized protein LOC105270326 [Fopius arisanus]